MVDPEKMREMAKRYKKPAIGGLGSHSFLNIAEGAVFWDFPTYVFCEKGREEPYRSYQTVWKSGKRVRGIIDNLIVLDKFSDLLKDEWQEFLRSHDILWIPNRSFWCYCGERRIQEEFKVPIIGSRQLLHLEDREKEEYNYYNILEEARIRTPEKISNPKEINQLVMVKLPHAVYKLERAFFVVTSTKHFHQEIKKLIKKGVLSKDDLPLIRIERFGIGPVCNVNFFYSPVIEELGRKGYFDSNVSVSPLELLSTERRFESNLDGLVRLPAEVQLKITSQIATTYIVVGHALMTVRESLLRFPIDDAKRFCELLKQKFPPGMIGAFGLQCVIEEDMKFLCYDVAFRIPGGDAPTIASGHPYSNALWTNYDGDDEYFKAKVKNHPISTGRRYGMEIYLALKHNLLDLIVT